MLRLLVNKGNSRAGSPSGCRFPIPKVLQQTPKLAIGKTPWLTKKSLQQLLALGHIIIIRHLAGIRNYYPVAVSAAADYRVPPLGRQPKGPRLQNDLRTRPRRFGKSLLLTTLKAVLRPPDLSRRVIEPWYQAILAPRNRPDRSMDLPP